MKVMELDAEEEVVEGRCGRVQVVDRWMLRRWRRGEER